MTPHGPQYEPDIETNFVAQYVQHHDAARACVEAGLSDANHPITVFARQVLKRPEIKASIAVREALGRLASLSKVTAEKDLVRWWADGFPKPHTEAFCTVSAAVAVFGGAPRRHTIWLAHGIVAFDEGRVTFVSGATGELGDIARFGRIVDSLAFSEARVTVRALGDGAALASARP